jgi:hypothetical protein
MINSRKNLLLSIFSLFFYQIAWCSASLGDDYSTTTHVSATVIPDIPMWLMNTCNSENAIKFFTLPITRIRFANHIQYSILEMDFFVSKSQDIGTGRIIYSAYRGCNKIANPDKFFSLITKIFKIRSEKEAIHALMDMSEATDLVDTDELATFYQSLALLGKDLK